MAAVAKAAKSTKSANDELVTAEFEKLSMIFYERLGPSPRREELEQWMCFLAAIWNGMVIFAQLGAYDPIRDVIRKIDALDPPQKEDVGELFLEIVERWLKDHKNATWLYRHVHVVVAKGGELRIRSEAVALDAWLAEGTPLRMGLPD